MNPIEARLSKLEKQVSDLEITSRRLSPPPPALSPTAVIIPGLSLDARIAELEKTNAFLLNQVNEMVMINGAVALTLKMPAGPASDLPTWAIEVMKRIP